MCNNYWYSVSQALIDAVILFNSRRPSSLADSPRQTTSPHVPHIATHAPHIGDHSRAISTIIGRWPYPPGTVFRSLLTKAAHPPGPPVTASIT
jgi:hypothetical protein